MGNNNIITVTSKIAEVNINEEVTVESIKSESDTGDFTLKSYNDEPF